MQAKDADLVTTPSNKLTAAQVADRMGLTPRQLQNLRLRGLGPQIVQRGLSIYYELADVQEIERHEAMLLIEQALSSDRPLVVLRSVAESVGFKLAPILQQVNLPTTATVPALTTVDILPGVPEPIGEVDAPPNEPESPPAVSTTPPPLIVVPSKTTAWYLVHTKVRQEDVARLNLERQGYQCYLPQMRIERVRRRKTEIVTEAMFPRYLFIRLDSSDQGKSWSPIRSTLGVSQLVHFGARAAKVDDKLVGMLRQREQAMPAETMFRDGESVVIAEGPFAGIEAIYQTADAEHRALILLEILSKPVSMQIDAGLLRKAG
jgi:transcriptional antiterminator RfaH